MTTSRRNLLKAFGSAAGAMSWLRKACGAWEWGRKLAALLLVAALALAAGPAVTQSAREGPRVTQANAPASVAARTERNALDAYGKLALAFVPNAGQTDQRVRFSAQAGGASFYFTSSEAVFAFTKEKKGLALRLAFLGANPAPQIAGARRGAGRINYMIGSDPARWRAGLTTYGEILYRDLWPGIDLVFRGENGELKYEFHLAPGADPREIRLAYRGAERLALGPDGELLIHTAFGVLSDSQPLSFQEIAGARVPVASKYSLEGRSYGIVPGPYDPSRPLIIDPGLAYSTYLGGGQGAQGLGIAVDSSGSAYVTGVTGAVGFPTTAGAFDTTFNGGNGLGVGDVFVTKLNPQGSALEYSTYLGGSANEVGAGIAVDTAGAAYVTGVTLSSNFPTTPGAFDTSYNGSLDAFVTKLDPAGATLVYSTYLGGSVSGVLCSPGPCADDGGAGIALDAAGNAYVTGFTRSANFPTTLGAFDRTYTSGAGSHVFVTKLDSNGATLVYSTYLGGATGEAGTSIAIDNAGAAYVTGVTGSIAFPTTPGAFDTTKNNGDDVFVAKVNADGSGLIYSTFLGGSLTDRGAGIAIDAAGNAYVTGEVVSADFPTTPGAFDTTFNGGARDAFVTKVNADGSGLVYSTFLGGSSGENGIGITVDAAGAAYVTGDTFSANFPTTPGAFDTTLAGNQDVFVTKLNETGSAALYSTYLGGGGSDVGRAIAGAASGSVYVTGTTTSNNFPITPGGFQSIGSFLGAAFITKISNQPPIATEDAATTDEDNPVTINLLANDADQDGDSLTLSAVTQGANGSVVINPDNTVTYSPAPNFNGADSFTYTVVDTWGDTDTGTVMVTINPVNDPPVAGDVSAATDEDLSVQINLSATDVDNSNLTYVIVSGPANGALGAISGATVIYTPNANFNGSDSITFKASDGTADSNIATVTITVAPVNDPPEAANDSASTNEDTAVIINSLANDEDMEGNTLSVTAASQGANGAVTINPDGTITYTPALNFFGSDTFTYTVSDGAGGSDTATVNVNVASVQDTPSANDDMSTVAEDSSPSAINVLANDSDVDGDTLTVASVTQGAHGSVANNGSSVSYTPAPNYFGPDTFTYTVSDGQGGVDTATVNVMVTSVNDAPLANGDVYSANFNTPLVVLTPGALANDADVEGDALTAALVTNVSNGTLALASDGSFTYTPNPNFTGADSFTYQASDGTSLSNVATVQITVASGASKVVFSSNRDGNFEIYSMNSDGTAQARLTNHSAIDVFPAWSPNNDKIAFSSNRDGHLNFEIYVMNADGSSPAPLTTNARVDGKPAWSPDGTKIAFSSNRDGNFEIYVMNADGSGLARLTNNWAIDSDPTWSPDGSKIAFSSNRDGVLNFEIYVMNAGGGGVTRLTNNSALDVSPAWSPDGTRIAFSSNRNGVLNFEVYVMNADGSAQTRLTTDSAVDGEPAWSPDGERIVFSTNRDGVLNFEIYVMNANGSGQTRLTTNPAADASPDW
jgi:Tol biopolymer transport system component